MIGMFFDVDAKQEVYIKVLKIFLKLKKTTMYRKA